MLANQIRKKFTFLEIEMTMGNKTSLIGDFLLLDVSFVTIIYEPHLYNEELQGSFNEFFRQLYEDIQENLFDKSNIYAHFYSGLYQWTKQHIEVLNPVLKTFNFMNVADLKLILAVICSHLHNAPAAFKNYLFGNTLRPNQQVVAIRTIEKILEYFQNERSGNQVLILEKFFSRIADYRQNLLKED